MVETQNIGIVHVRGFWPSVNRWHGEKIGFRGRMTCRAAALMNRYEHVDYFVLATGRVLGKDSKPVNELMRDEMVRLGVPEEKIILTQNKKRPVAESLGETESFFREYLRHDEWHKENQRVQFYELGWQFHLDGIKRHIYGSLAKEKGITFRPVESVIKYYSKYNQPSLHRVLRKIQRSQLQVNFFIWEKIVKEAAYRLRGPEWAREKAERDRNNPNVKNFALPIDHD